MKEKRIKLGIILSSIPLLNYAHQIAEERDEIIQYSSKGLEESITAGKRMERDGVEVIVSRGGTSHILKENLHIPVLNIPITSMDLLTVINKASSLGKRILLTTFRNTVSGIKIFENLFNIEILLGVYEDSESLEKAINSANNEGYEVVIGGGVSMRIAEECGMRGLELHTPKETISSMLDDAENVARLKREERKKAERYRCIIDAASEGIIAVDQDGFITIANKQARNLLGLSDNDGINKHITKVLPNTQILESLRSQKPLFNRIEKINGGLVLGNHTPIRMGNEIVGGVSTFKDITNVMKAENEVRRSLAKGMIAKHCIDDVIGQSVVMKDVLRKTRRCAVSDLTILITGETGTGKEIIAQSIHGLSKRKNGSFVSVNCASLPEQLLESELFGYEEGAFTGARKGGKPGLFELAHKGTIFLDEIGATTQNLQARLLRVLQEKEVRRIAGDRVIPVDVRVIAASNIDLVEELKRGRFREDLFFRLNVLYIHMPPLRERTDDIPLLVNELIKRVVRRERLNSIIIPETFIKKLMEYHWPGNIRQLENFVERLVLLSDSEINYQIFNELYQQLIDYSMMKGEPIAKKMPLLKEYLQAKTWENEKAIIMEVLREEKFCKTKTAKRLGISRSTLWRKLKEEASFLESNQ
jgi:PAS domain S-box-containing protein